MSLKIVINKTINWINNNTLETENGKGIIINSNKKIIYPEVTGYIIPTILNFGLTDLAKNYAKYLINIQNENGGYGLNNISYVFDTGQVLRGFVTLYKLNIMKEELYNPILKICDWLLNDSLNDNKFYIPKSGWTIKKKIKNKQKIVISEGVYLYVLEYLKYAVKNILNNEGYIKIVLKIEEYYINIQYDFKSANMLTHFYAYILEAKVDLGYKIDVNEFLKYKTDEYIPAYYNEKWLCTPGYMQLGIILYKTGYIEEGNKVLDNIIKYQENSGGLKGSYGDNASYFQNDELSWNAKYLLDLINQKIITHNDLSIYKNKWTNINNSDDRLKYLLEYINIWSNDKILDAGCGQGRYCNYIYNICSCYNITAIDICENNLKSILPNINKKIGNINNIDNDDNYYDIVYSIEVIEHIVNYEESIKEMIRVLKSNGKLIIIDKTIDFFNKIKKKGSWESGFNDSDIINIYKKYNLKNIKSQYILDNKMILWYGEKI